MMRPRMFMLSLGLVVFALVASGVTATLVSCGTQEAEAQSRTAQPPIRLGVVDFTRLSRDLSDVEKIRSLMTQLDELREIEQQYWRRQIERLERDIAAGERFREYIEDHERELREAQASYDAVTQVIEFRMKKNATMFASRLLQKILDRIDLYSDGRFDMVFKVLGDPSGEEGMGEDLVGDAQKLNLAQAREVLYFSQSSDYVTDITDRVRRMVNDPGGADDVSPALDEAISQVRDEIDEVRERMARD